MSGKRVKAYKKGLRAEFLAGLALMVKGYRIVARRYKTPAGEIDLIAVKGDLVVFVEVKARRTEQAALDSISNESQRRISNAANWWLARQNRVTNPSWRFDVMAVRPWKWPAHYEDVW